MKKTDLIEIKKDHTGKGLLIENDGYMSFSNEQHKYLKESMGSGEWHCPYPFVVDAVFQKFGIKNANGRIYPEGILKKQVALYQQRIQDKRAIGECYTPDVLVLTESGWKKMADIKEGDNVLTLNVETKEIEINPVLHKIEYNYEGDMIEIHNNNIWDLVTPNHKFPIFNSRNDKFVDSYTAEAILNDEIADMKHKYIPKRGIWKGKNDEYFTIPNVYPSLYDEDLKIPMTTFAKFMGIYLSEGCRNKCENSNSVFIYQEKKDICEDITNMLNEWGINYTIEEKNGTLALFISDRRLCNYLQQFGLSYDKFVPLELKQQNKEILQLFYEWFVKGYKKNHKAEHMTDEVFSISERLILDLNEIQMKIGYSGHYHMEKRDNDRLIEGKNCHPMHFSLRSRAKSIMLDKRYLKCNKIPYNGTVMCIEVKNHNFYVMSNGRSHWTSNCNHPSDSTIDLGRISHNITELHWEGRTLVGKLELNVTQGFVKHGIASSFGDTIANLLLNGYKIGVSSRGVGSVEQKLGQYIVGDDFELICWDIVADPSTPNAYIGSSREELQPYMESVEHKGTVLNEKVNKIKNILKS